MMKNPKNHEKKPAAPYRSALRSVQTLAALYYTVQALTCANFMTVSSGNLEIPIRVARDTIVPSFFSR